MTTAIYIAARVPEAEAHPEMVREWTAVCREASFVWISHEPFVERSRWTHTMRAKPFIVEHVSRGRAGLAMVRIGGYKTFEQALAAATKAVA